VDGLTDLSLKDLRERRDRALAEREFVSYLRRQIQVRIDVLEGERSRRVTGEHKDMVERLTEALSEGPQGPGRGEALRLSLSEDDMAEADRRTDAVISVEEMSNLEALSDDELEGAIGALREEEGLVSRERTAVLRVHDQLQDELKRRYREDPSLATAGF
jgi:hypothetical protein